MDVRGKVVVTHLEEEMKRSYIDYAMSVIVSRALPDIRDGLKPVHRRILFAMYDRARSDQPYVKSGRVVGDVIGKYHPHGDVAIYDAMVRLAQDFSSRYPLIDGHGNFGSVDGDPPAAMRYTEVRMASLAMEMLRDIDKDTVGFHPNYDDKEEEPDVLPARFPNLLVNGSAGIAVGMATNIPPHNLGEVIDAVVHLIEHPQATLDDIMRIIPGPDFPTGGLILGRGGIEDAYRKGRGSILMRAQVQIETPSSGKPRIVVTELPFQVNKARLIERIAELVREKKIEGITDIRDDSTRHGTRVVIDLKRETSPRILLNRLYKLTPLQQTFGVITLALVNGAPRILNLLDTLKAYLEHQKEVIVRRTRYELRKAEEEAHILEGLRIALDHLDAIIALIRSSPDVKTAHEGLMTQFSLSDRQATAILEMRLQRLTALERHKIEEQYQALQKTIAYLRAVLSSDQMVLDIIKTEIQAIKEKHADPRRTRILSDEGTEVTEIDLIPEEEVVITLTHQGYVKRQPLTTYRSQRRGGRGISGARTKETDFVEHLFVTTTHYRLLVFTNRGRVYSVKVHEIPDASRQAKGTAIVNLAALDGNEQITAVIPVKAMGGEGFLLMATRAGIVKKTPLSEFQNLRQNGLIAIGLDAEDELIVVQETDGRTEVLLATRSGMALRFSESAVRAMGRSARGVLGIRLGPDDQVVGMERVMPDRQLLVISQNGYGKRTPLMEYRQTGRGGKGIRTLAVNAKNGPVVGILAVAEEDEVMLISSGGILIRMAVSGISEQGRSTQGVMLMRLEGDTQVVALARVAVSEEAGER